MGSPGGIGTDSRRAETKAERTNSYGHWSQTSLYRTLSGSRMKSVNQQRHRPETGIVSKREPRKALIFQKCTETAEGSQLKPTSKKRRKTTDQRQDEYETHKKG